MSGETKQGPKWFSIKQAAKYLSIGEPTLYRWMRDNKITYRKIGDSTRFLQEDLDEFVQVFHSKRSIEAVKEVCPVCHHDEMIDGVFRTTGLNHFRVKKTKFWTVKDSNVKTTAKMCTRCGTIAHFGDIKKLNAIIHPPEPQPESKDSMV